DRGHRCQCDSRLELDHIEPVARGGETTVENLRLRCRAHNQHEAERVFGAGFMERKRAEARERKREDSRAGDRAREQRAVGDVSVVSHQLVPEPVVSSVPEQVAAQANPRARRDEVVPYLRALGFRVDEAKRGAAMCDAMPGASLEARVRFAISGLGRGRFERCTQMPSPVG
ncbi:MAG: HNH endonuclease, partial [Candidatus Eisenbacteria bacterium]